MRVLIVRHAAAEDREAFARTGKADDARPLTDDGRRSMQRAARGLVEVVPAVDLVVTSPLKRAVQTAQIVAKAYGGATVERVPALSPGSDPGGIVEWLRGHREVGTVVLVGHEPDLSMLISVLAIDSVVPFVSLKKGAVCLLEFSGEIGGGEAVIRWLLGPKHLRAIGAHGA